ncbi:hypothetical protein [uncultured Tenacibaculum sp.]|uniref:hypothetical protein n=1 Tax=uncultured Tenacibaculum sp. TaxID=174713 RepID=UPI002604507F|nr:hypothetical protein [uncultured Tenacibaculum sp.]
MKNQFLLLMFITLLYACSDNNAIASKSTVYGKWKLIEILADPGDGSGVFQQVMSDKTLEFKENGIVITNTSLCNPYSEEVIGSGSYDFTEKVIRTGCENSNISKIYFEFENEYLILNFISNEGYSQKFEKQIE